MKSHLPPLWLRVERPNSEIGVSARRFVHNCYNLKDIRAIAENTPATLQWSGLCFEAFHFVKNGTKNGSRKSLPLGRT